MPTLVVVFGTRPEAIKLAPLVWALRRRPSVWRCVTVCTSQHDDLLRPFLSLLDLPVDHDLQCMRHAQTPADVMSRVLLGLQDVLREEAPAAVAVQGDTTTALAGAMAGFYARVPVAHVEAGLRTGDVDSPFPEEAHRRQIAVLATWHLAATDRNRDTLLREGCAADRVIVTGNPVVDALHWVRREVPPSADMAALLQRLSGRRLLVLTTHRRENFGTVMQGHLRAVRDFARRHADIEVVFPVHPNPQVRQAAQAVLGGEPRVHLLPPLPYGDFVHLLSQAWLVCSDSGGIQEEAPTLRKPVLILRDTTERPEVLECGVGRLAGHAPERLLALLEQAHADDGWTRHVEQVVNPFGQGDAGERIVRALEQRCLPRVAQDRTDAAAPDLAQVRP